MIVKTAAYDYLYKWDDYKEDLTKFFTSTFFAELMKHFGTDPNDFLHELYYQKVYYLKSKTKKSVHIKIRKKNVAVEITGVFA